MAITKEKKQDILAKLDTIKNESKTLVFVGFNGLSGIDATSMRSELRGEDVGYLVAKKTLIRKALGDAYKGELPELDGEVAVAYSADAIAPAQNILLFEKKFKDQISILGGVFAGVYKNKEEMSEIASIPALPVLRGMFVNVINAPIQGLVLGLSAIADKKSA